MRAHESRAEMERLRLESLRLRVMEFLFNEYRIVDSFLRMRAGRKLYSGIDGSMTRFLEFGMRNALQNMLIAA